MLIIILAQASSSMQMSRDGTRHDLAMTCAINASTQNHSSEYLGGWATPWSAEEMLNGQYQRVDIPAHATRSGELRMQKLKSHLVRTQSLNVLPLKPGVGQYIAIHATLTAREFFLAYFHPSSPFTCIFSKTSPNFFPVLACRIK